MNRFFNSLIYAIVACLAISVAHATMVLPVNLQEMAERADRIFLGQVVKVEDKFDSEGRWSQFITFSVTETFKGEVGSELTIKQVNLNPAQLSDGTIIRSTLFQGVPQYKDGEEVLLFLRGDSTIGYTSPVGLSQGAFRILQDEFGDKKLVNGVANMGLFQNVTYPAALKSQGMSTNLYQNLQRKPGELYLDQMRSMLKVLTTSEQNSAKE